MVRLTDSVTDAIGSTTSAGTNSFLSSFANTLSPSNGSASAIGGGPILLVFISLLHRALNLFPHTRWTTEG